MKQISAWAASLLIGGTAFAQTPLAVPLGCPADRAVYELSVPDSDEVWRLSLRPARNTATIASNLYVQLDSPAQNTYWFTFNVSQGYSGISVFPVSNPYLADGPRDLLGEPFGDNPQGSTSPDVLGALRALPMDVGLTVLFEPPMRDDPAPAYFMFPELGQVLWYEPEALSSNTNIEREGMPRGVFKLVECLPQAHPEALP